MKDGNEICEALEVFIPKILTSLEEIVELDITCKSILKQHLVNKDFTNPSTLIKVQAIIDYMYEKINIGNWKEVKLYLRKTITLASYIKLLCQLRLSNELTDKLIRDCFKTIDFGLLFGCPIDGESKLLQSCATIINSENSSTEASVSINCSPFQEPNKNIVDNSNIIPISVINFPSMEHFYSNYILTETPVILENCMNHWPALTKWKDQEYFIKLAGLRTVAIELGSKYTDSEWTQKLMTIEEFIKSHIYEPKGPTGYLAQYQLFDQIPELKEDIREPEYCCFSDSNEAVDINAWYGPKGTVSPLHHDPKRNLLAQVVGEKQLFIFPLSDSEYLYPHEHELLNNTAQVDPRQPDLIKFPKYANVRPHYCILKPGQMLYIPPKWWHFVESLSISFSVSFWWE